MTPFLKKQGFENLSEQRNIFIPNQRFSRIDLNISFYMRLAVFRKQKGGKGTVRYQRTKIKCIHNYSKREYPDLS